MNATHAKALAAALLAVPALSSCSVNFDAQTDQVYTPADGENERSGTVDVLNALIVSDTPGSGRLIAGLANADTTEPDSITQVRGVGESEGAQFTIEGGEATIPAGGLLQLADPDAAVVSVTGDPELVRAGAFVRLAISFENGEEAALNVPVVAPGTDYADVELGGGSSASPSPSE